MAESTKEFYQEFPKQMAQAQKALPDTFKGFGALFQGTMKDSALKTKEKELIALGIAMAQRCKPCINLHVQKSIEAGNSREEILEAAAVAVVMQGGPAFTHLPEILEALEALGK